MANLTSSKIWSLDTVAGVVTDKPIGIHAIHVRFTTAGAGSCVLTTFNSTDVILDLQTTAASTAVVWSKDIRQTFGDQAFVGLNKLLMVNVETVYIVTSKLS